MSRLSLSALAVASLFLAKSTQAQQPVLERVSWKSQERGPLLVVALEAEIPTPSGSRAPTWDALFSEGEINVLTLASALERKLVRVGNLSALVPTHYRALNPKLGKPDFSQLRPEAALLALTVSLDVRQWALFTSATGIGERDLTDTQKNLFAQVLPKALQVGTANRAPGQPAAVPVREEAVAQARLSFRRRLQLFLAFQDSSLNGSAVFPMKSDPRPELDRDESRPTTQWFYGATLTERLPNRLKPSNLDYKSPLLDRRIALQNMPTIEALLERVTQATGMEIRADKRLGLLPVWLRSAPNTNIRVGDLLEAVALSVSGAFRKLETPSQGKLWLLTDDIEGLDTRLTMQQQWMQEASRQMQGVLKKNQERLKTLLTSRTVPLENPLNLPQEMFNKLDSTLWQPTLVPLSTVDPRKAQTFRQAAEQKNQAMREGSYGIKLGGAQNPLLDTNHLVAVAENYVVHWDVPGYGVYVDRFSGASIHTSLIAQHLERNPPQEPPIPPRPTVPKSLAIVAPKNAEEAKRLVAAAATIKLRTLWITTDGTDLAALRAALEAGKTAGVAVGALLPLLSLPESAVIDKAAQPDKDVLGQPGVYRIPDAPETLAQLLPKLQALAPLPDLASLTLTETGAPGYLRQTYSNSTGDSTEYLFVPRYYGYTPERRMAFIRSESYDPIDLDFSKTPETIGALTSLGKIPLTEKHPLARWNAVRYQANQALLTQIYGALKRTAPQLPLWLKSRWVSSTAPYWYGSWDKPDALPTFIEQYEPPTDGSNYDPYNPLPQARKTSKQVLFSDSVAFVEEKVALRDWWTLSLDSELQNRGSKTFPWDGAVLDLSTLPLEKAVSALQEIKL